MSGKVVTQHTQYLWDYSQSYEFPTPFIYFTDIIGWSEAHYGGRIADPAPTIGYLEARLIGEALVEYADDPEAVVGFVNEVLFGNQLEVVPNMSSTQEVKHLYEYSQSYDTYDLPSPLSYFLDIVGYRIDEPMLPFDYTEALLIAKALVEHANNAEAVNAFIRKEVFGAQLELPLDTGGA